MANSSPAQAPEPPSVRGPQRLPRCSRNQRREPIRRPRKCCPLTKVRRLPALNSLANLGIDPERVNWDSSPQRPGEVFSRQRVEESLAALKRTGQFHDVQLQVLPEAEGLRVLLVLQPAIYYGIYHFPGAERFSYTRLLQVTNYPPTGPYSPVDVQNRRRPLSNSSSKGPVSFKTRSRPSYRPMLLTGWRMQFQALRLRPGGRSSARSGSRARHRLKASTLRVCCTRSWRD